jgi:hypothetical protein
MHALVRAIALSWGMTAVCALSIRFVIEIRAQAAGAVSGCCFQRVAGAGEKRDRMWKESDEMNSK